MESSSIKIEKKDVKRNFFINCITENWIVKILESEKVDLTDKTFYEVLNEYLETTFECKVDTIYFCTKEIIFSSKTRTLVTKYKNIKFLHSTSSFHYLFKQLGMKGKIKKDDYVLTNNIWDYYLVSFPLQVYTLSHIGIKSIFKRLDQSLLNRHVGHQIDPKYFTDYVFLQEKNIESLGMKKTLKLLKEFGGIEGLVENINNIEDSKVRGLISFQKQKLEYYLHLKKLFLLTNEIGQRKETT